jgi:hypothetical protein
MPDQETNVPRSILDEAHIHPAIRDKIADRKEWAASVQPKK